MVIERASLKGHHETNETCYWILPDTAERRWTVMCRRAVLQGCLLQDFYFLHFSTRGKKKKILLRTRGNSIFLSFHFFSLKTGSSKGILLCYVMGASERKDSRLILGISTRPSRLVSWLHSNGLVSGKLTGSEVLQKILHVAYISLGLSEVKIETREGNWEI